MRNQDCSVLLKQAALNENRGNIDLQLAAKVCKIEAQPAGCYIPGGFQPPSRT